MRTLFLIRHAKSSWGNPGLRDFDRPLNDRGLHDAPKMGQFLVKQGVKPDYFISSPAKRAYTTALFFAKAFDTEASEVHREPGIYEASPTDILRIISGLPDTAVSVCIFGHNPTFTELANRFTDNHIIENIPTCGVVKISSSADSWKAFDAINSSIAAAYFPKEVL